MKIKGTIGFLALMLAMPAINTAQTTGQPATGRPARVRTRMDGFDLSPQSGKKANQVGAASRGLGAPALFAPGLGKDFSTHPVFYWASPVKGDKVTFKLTADNGQAVYEKATTEEWLRYPDDAPGLEPGKSYRWTIAPENDMLGGAPEPVSFQIVSGKDRDTIEKQLKAASNANAMAKVFMDNRIWYDAVASYSNVLERMPNDQDARAARAAIYDQLPVTKPLAEADWRMVH